MVKVRFFFGYSYFLNSSYAFTRETFGIIVLLTRIYFVGYQDPDGEGGLEEDLAARRYRALIPDEDSGDDY